MHEVTIQDYIGSKKLLTAEEVRKLQAGAKVELHSFDRYGAHQVLEMTVIQSGKKKVLGAYNFFSDGRIIKPIVSLDGIRRCYTEGKNNAGTDGFI